MKHFFLFALFLLVCACKQKPNKETRVDIPEEVIEQKILPPLEPGNISYKNKNPFGATIELTGTQLVDDSVIWKVRESKMIIKNNHLIISNRQEYPFMLFGLPDGQFLRYGKGKMGQGPDEYNFPVFVPTTDTTLLCYIYESTNRKMYRFLPTGDIVYYPFEFDKTLKINDNQFVNIAPDDFMYVKISDTGKSIFRTTGIGDSVITRKIYDLGLNPRRKGFANYIGDFVVNPKQNRMAYAYKYFKVIKFMDLEAQTVRTIDFEREQFDDGTNYIADGLDSNVTHYWGASAGEDYVYFLYSGRKPADVWRDNNKKEYYIFVEQYDWNGNPVHTYKLDRWGYFCVDESNKQIYLASTNDDDPIFVFTIPEL
jgi:hypothetical protein